MKTIIRLTYPAAGFVAASLAAMSFCVPPAHAGSYGNAPWCAVQNLGAGDVVWDCEFRSVEECAPHVIAGNRGFCNINPSFVPPASAPPIKHRKRRS
jgi:hypothetical protein